MPQERQNTRKKITDNTNDNESIGIIHNGLILFTVILYIGNYRKIC